MERRDLSAALRIASILLLIFLLLKGGNSVCAQWLEGYSHRLKITINESLVPGSESLTGFPVLFSYADPTLRSTSNGGSVYFADGMDFCFTDQDSITVVDYEIENYDPVTGSLSAWIRIPSVSAVSNTELFLYYGNPEGLPLWDKAGVWSNQYTAVWHMADDPSGDGPQINDATSLMNHGTTGGGMYVDDLVDGKISRGIQFDGVDDYAIMPVAGFNTDAGTVELWINLYSMPASTSDYFFAHRQEEPTTDRAYLRVWSDGEWGTGMGDTYDLIRGDTLDTGSWHHLAISWNGLEVIGFLDGVQDFGPVLYAALDTVREIYVMTWMPGSESASGTLDELRVSGVDRDSAWIAASYLIQHQPESYYQVQSQFVNDFPCNSIHMEINDSCIFSIHTNLGAGDSGIPDPGCGAYLGGDIWFNVIVPESGSFEIQTDTETEAQFPDNNGWMYRAAMAIYSGTCDSLVLLGCYENNSSYHPRMAGTTVSGQNPGDTIWVRLWENTNNDIGMFKICVSSLDQVRCPSVFTVSGGGGFCQGDTGVAITLSGSETEYAYTLLLNDSIALDSLAGTGDTLIWSPVLNPGVYRIIAHHPSDSCSLPMSDSAVVELHDLPQLSFDVVSSSCFEGDNGTITTTITGGTEPYLSTWSGPDGFTSSELILIDLAPGAYSLTVTDQNQCMTVGPEIFITGPELLTASLDEITHLSSYEANDGSAYMTITGGTPPYQVSWTGTDDYVSTDQNPTGMTVGTYNVMVTDDHLCQDSIRMIVVSVEEDARGVFIPEGFSPNGDGYNDLFEILGIEAYPENELVVFNRQGVEIFHRVNYRNDWDGTPEMGDVLGGVLPEGTYYYVFKFGEISVVKGYLYLNKE